MARLAELGITIDSRPAQQGAAQVKSALGDIETSAQRMTRGLQAAAGAIGLAFGARQLIEYADQFKLLEGRLALVTRGTADLARVQGALFALAQGAGQAFGDVADLYTRMARSADELGATQQQMLGVTEAVGLALKVSGTSSTQAAGALQQLSQALAAGTVRAEEFNSILEGAPRIAQAAADGLGLSLGQLRHQLLEGNLTSRAFFDGILSQLPVLKAEAESLPPTVGAAFTALNNSLGAFVAGADQAVGATDLFAQAIKGTATFIDQNRLLIESLTLALGTGGLALALARGVTGLAAFGAANVAMAGSVGTGTAALVGARVAADAFWLAVTGPIGKAVAAMAAVGGAFYLWRDGAREAAKEVRDLAGELGKATLATANRELAQAEADRVGALRTLQTGGLVGEDLREATTALQRATERTTLWTAKLKELRAETTGTAQTLDPFAAKVREAQGALDAFRRAGDLGVQAFKLASEEWGRSGTATVTFAAALEAGDTRAKSFLDSAQRLVGATKALADAQEGAQRATRASADAQKRAADIEKEYFDQSFRFWQWLEQRRQARTRAEDYVTDLREMRSQIVALENEQAALLGGADAYREYTIEMAQAAAVRQALAQNPAMTEEEIASLREGVRLRILLEENNARLKQRLGNQRSEFDLSDAAVRRTQEWASALGSVVSTLQELGTVLNGTGNDAVKMLGILATSLEGLARAQQRAKDAAAAGQRQTGTQAAATAIGGAVGSFGAGVAVGSSTSSRTVGALGGALAGAATGAAAGSAVPVIGTAIGAAVGALVGAIGGLVGASDNATQQLIAQRAAQEQLNEALTALRASFAGDPLGQAVAQARAQFAQLRQQTEAAFSGKKNEEERNRVLAELNVLEAQRVALLQQQYAEAMRLAMGDLEVRRLRATGQDLEAARLADQLAQQRELTDATTQFGADSPYVAALQEVQAAERAAAEAVRQRVEAERLLAQQFNARDILLRERALGGTDTTADRLRLEGDLQLAQAQKLVESGELTAEMFSRLAAVIDGEILAALRAAEEAAALAAATIRDDLAVRALVAQGRDAEAAALRRELAFKAELAGITDATLVAEIEYVQQLEREAVLKDELAAAAARALEVERRRLEQNQSIDERMLRAQGRDDEADALRLRIQREQELRDAVDATTRARLEELYAMEDAAKAARDAADALAQQAAAAERLAGLTFDVSVDLLEAEGNAFEAQRQRIMQRGEQRRRELLEAGASAEALAQLDRLIQRQLDNLIASTIESAGRAAGATPGAPRGDTEFVTANVARSISGAESLRLIDLAASQLQVLQVIARNTEASGGGVRIQVTVQAAAIATSPDQLGRQIAQQIAPLVDTTLGRRAGVDRRAMGATAL